MGLMAKLKHLYKKMFSVSGIEREYLARHRKFSFDGISCKSFEQYEASITRLYHTIEKGLSYENYRAGFGQSNVDSLLTAMEHYVADGFDCNTFFFETALSVLAAYVSKNREYAWQDLALEKRINNLPGKVNEFGGILDFTPLSKELVQSLDFENFIKNRHSIRHFSGDSVSFESLKKAISLAQFTPSACNRQGWKTRIVSEKALLAEVLKWQNGNRGFGDELDKLLLVTADVRYFSKGREFFQAFIDGGMYAANILNALHYERIGSIPLSASLTLEQEKNVRRLLKMDDAEVFILFIGVGSYPEKCRTTRSERHEPRIVIL